MSSEVSTASRVASATPGLSLSTRLTVASLTSACAAMSASVAFMAVTLARTCRLDGPHAARYFRHAARLDLRKRLHGASRAHPQPSHRRDQHWRNDPPWDRLSPPRTPMSAAAPPFTTD